MRKFYDNILFFETKFQKFILDYLIQKGFIDGENLIISVSENGFQIGGDSIFPISLNSSKGIIKATTKLNKFPKLHCKNFIGPHITSCNSIFLCSKIESKNLIMIDDGMATIKRVSHVSRSYFNQRVKITYLKFFVTILGERFISEFEIMQRIKTYFTIYDTSTSLPVKKINPFNTNKTKILFGEVGFIGQPLVEHGVFTEKAYMTQLKKIVSRENKLKYYLHPKEKWYKNQSIEGIEFIKSTSVLEERAQKDGMPEKLISYYSSSLIHLKLCNNSLDMYYIKMDTPKYKWLKNVFLENGINEYTF